VGSFLLDRLSLLGKIAGVIIVLFGLHLMGVLRIGWLHAEKRVQTDRKPATLIGAGLVGIAFAFGWTPCIGPILAGILAIAAGRDTVMEGVKLLAAYSLGLGIPFVATSLAINQFYAAFARIRHHYQTVEIVSGGLLVAVGLLIFTNRFTVIAQLLSPYLPTF
jgi:cytochrome c-type biogenesis protein